MKNRIIIAFALAITLAASIAQGQSVKVYRALISQTGTSAPVADVLENNFSSKIQWVRIGYGSYQAHSSGEFTPRTFLLIHGLTSSLDFGQADFYRAGGSTITLLTRDVDVTTSAQLFDGLLSHTSVEIRVYPFLE